MELVNFILVNGPAIIQGLTVALTGLIMVALVIPGEQPEKALQSAVEFLKRFSRK